MSFFHRGGPGRQGQSLQFAVAKVADNGASTGLFGLASITAAWADNSCVLTWSPAFKNAVGTKVFVQPTSAGASTYQALVTGIGVDSVGINFQLSGATATTIGFNVLLIGPMNL